MRNLLAVAFLLALSSVTEAQYYGQTGPRYRHDRSYDSYDRNNSTSYHPRGPGRYRWQDHQPQRWGRRMNSRGWNHPDGYTRNYGTYNRSYGRGY
jgi:hypothetical protein